MDAKPDSETQITPEIVAEHGLTADEYKRLLKILGRSPSLTELGIFSVMWSEHCSYKSSRVWLKSCRPSGPQVIQGPGENAGVVDIGDGWCVVFKMESHNHPCYIEPYQGAATGVGGIMRDVFTMGARPVANLNALRFGAPDHAKTRHLVAGVVAGIGGYGNCVGVPTVGGETNFDTGYDGNILVNAMCVGLARADKIFYSAAKGVGLPVVYVGSKTGRDGIHGATMASAEFDDKSEEKRPTVQVGDPFTEKLLDRGVPRADGDGRDRRHPGHGRGRPHLVLRRDGGQGRRRHRARPRPRAPARGGHDRLRDDAVGKPGAHADRPEARGRGRGAGDLRQMGSRLRRHRRDDRHRPHDRHARRGARSPTSRWRRSPTTRRSTSGPGSHPPAPQDDPARMGAGPQRHPRCAEGADGRPRALPRAAGSGSSTTTW